MKYLIIYAIALLVALSGYMYAVSSSMATFGPGKYEPRPELERKAAIGNKILEVLDEPLFWVSGGNARTLVATAFWGSLLFAPIFVGMKMRKVEPAD